MLDVFRGRGAWPYLVAVLAGVAWLFASGIPTGIIETPFYVRMTPVEWWNYPFWISNSLLVGLLAATYVSGLREKGGFGGGMGGGLLMVFAIGCPVCNKLVVLALGFGGAMTYFAPVQPFLGFVSTGLLVYAVRVRLAGEVSCPVVAVEREERSETSTG